MSCPVSCLTVVLIGSCLALKAPYSERKSVLFCVSLSCDLCSVCYCLFALPVGVNVHRLYSLVVAFSRQRLYYYLTNYLLRI